MTLQDLRFALELGCVMNKDIDAIVAHSKANGINKEYIDEQLLELGYGKILDDTLEDLEDEDEDDGYIQKFPPKNRFYEE
jgi:hypothetical protein